MSQVPPLGRPQVPSVSQTPARHWLSPVQGRELGRPQRLSAGSHRPPTHTAWATVELQTPPPCRVVSVGMGVPAGSLGVHLSVGASQ